MNKAPPRIEALRVKGYRALADIELKKLTPLTVLLGPNGSGKSTVFDVFAFLSECFQSGLRQAWDRRGRFRELRTRGYDGPVEIELKYREAKEKPLITYHLSIDEGPTGPFAAREWMRWKRKPYGAPFRFLDFAQGKGQVVSGEMPDEEDERVSEELKSAEFLAVNTLGQFAKHPRVAALREFITSWHLSYLSTDASRETPESGPAERLSRTGDNLPNVIQFLQEQHPERLEKIWSVLASRVPQVERVDSSIMADGRLLLQIKDCPFEKPILAKYASDGTLKMLAYLTLLYDPEPPQLVGIEEPENFLHPRLLPDLAEECRRATLRTQLMVTTHSPFFLDGVRPQEVRVLYRDTQGFTQAKQASNIRGIPEFIDAGALLGSLWTEGRFGLGDPLVRQGRPAEGAAG